MATLPLANKITSFASSSAASTVPTKGIGASATNKETEAVGTPLITKTVPFMETAFGEVATV